MIAVFVLTIAILIFFVHRRLLERTGQRPLAAEDGTADTVTSPPTLADSAALLTCSEETKRNQVSVLFVGIKGFKTYAENREPEALMEDLNEYLSIATSSVEEFGGFVDKLVGDGVISVFANSAVAADHAERAVGAALAMQRTFKEKGTTGNQLLLRAGIGISSGVVLSGCVGSGETKEIAYLGESFRTAYSLTVMAGPGEIILSKEAYRLLENTISVEPLPPREVLQRTQSWENFRLLEKL
jgi:class 3 adenylate cyclase